MNVEAMPATTHLTIEERQKLIQAVEQWEEWSAAFYVDQYLAPTVLDLLERRVAAATALGKEPAAGHVAPSTGPEGANPSEPPPTQ